MQSYKIQCVHCNFLLKMLGRGLLKGEVLVTKSLNLSTLLDLTTELYFFLSER